MNTAALQSVESARLPAVYENAKTALATCSRIDECAEWANKADAIASYARQAEDDALLNTAQRIKARAIRRCGELLREIAPAKGGRPPSVEKTRGGAPPSLISDAMGGVPPSRWVGPPPPPPPPISREAAGKAAGMSRDQIKQAQRVAAVPAPLFEASVESAKPPTVTALAEQGKKPSTAHLKGRDPKEYAASTRAQGALRSFAEGIAGVSAALTVRGAVAHEYQKMRANAEAAATWIDSLLEALEAVQ